MERVTFISCGIILTNTENTLITTCMFQNNIGSAVSLDGSTCNVSITNCTFQNNSATDGGAMWFNGSTGNVSITNCTFQNNSAAYVGGAVWLDGSTGNVSITNCTFQSNSAAYFGGAVWLYGSTGDVSITNCTFQNNSATYGDGGAVWLDGSTGNVSITNCTFQSNSAAYFGGAVWLYGSTGDVSITNCTFHNNSATYGDGDVVGLLDSTSNVSITNSTFQNNSAIYGGTVWLYGSTGDVSITNCTFQNNSATYGDGGAVLLYGSTGNVSVTNCTVQSNTAAYGGAVILYGSTGNVSITNCIFQYNSATFDGGAIYISETDLVIFDKSTFINNTAVRGAAVYASNIHNAGNFVNQIGNLTFEEVIVENNHCSCNGYSAVRGGAVYFNAMTVDIVGDTITGSQFLSNSPLGAITEENGFMQLHGNVSFYNNTGENGGAISLSNNVPLHFDNSCTVEFSSNVATGYGGAIYNDGGPSTKERGYYPCTIIFIADSFGNVSSSITFTDNHAHQGGHAVYATPIYGCYCIQANFVYCETSYFTIISLPQDHNALQVLSFPTHVQRCNCSDPDLCNVLGQYEGKVTTYPGRTVRLNVISVGDENYLSPSVVYASDGTDGDITTTITLGPGDLGKKLSG